MSTRVAVSDVQKGDLAKHKLGDQFLWVLSLDTGRSSATIDYHKLYKALQRNNLSRFTPKAPRKHDAFRRASKALEKTQVTLDSGRRASFLVREVHCDHARIERHLIQETIDTQNKTVNFELVAHLVFDKIKEEASWSVVAQGPDVDLYKRLIRGAMNMYKNLSSGINDMRIRAMLRDIVMSLHPTVIKQGVYFIPNHPDLMRKLDSIEGLIKDLSSSNGGMSGAKLFSQRLAILPKDKVKVEGRMRDQTMRQLKEIQEEFNREKSAGTLTPKKIADMLLQMGELQNKIKIYQEVVRLDVKGLKKVYEETRNILMSF